MCLCYCLYVKHKHDDVCLLSVSMLKGETERRKGGFTFCLNAKKSNNKPYPPLLLFYWSMVVQATLALLELPDLLVWLELLHLLDQLEWLI